MNFLRNSCFILIASVLALLTAIPAWADQHAGVTWTETPEQRAARLDWWHRARFGMFIHWGVYSGLGGTWQGKKIGGMGEWIMCTAHIPISSYTDYCKTFNPVKFNADTWVQIAHDAGMKYMVITAKHHDGFAMFDTKFSPNNIVTGTAYGKDPLKALAKSCADNDMALGFYYSQALDWTNGGALSCPPWDFAQTPTPKPEYVERVVLPQLKELLTNYGAAPKILWWDWSSRLDRSQGPKIFNEVRALKPEAILNDRLNGAPNDFDVQESTLPFHAVTDYNTGKPTDWETCMTLNDTWGYRSDDANWKSTKTLIQMLCDINSKGGNFMLNIGPDGLGQFPPACVDRLRDIGVWMRVNGSAIYSSAAGPFTNVFNWGRVGRVGNTYNLFIFNWPADGRIEVPLSGAVANASILGYPGETVTTVSNGHGTSLTLPKTAPDEPVATIALQFKEEPKVLPYLIEPASDGSFHLPASDCDMEGKERFILSKEDPPCIDGWRKAAVAPIWTIDVPMPGKYMVSATYACDQGGAGSPFQIKVGPESLSGTVQASKGRYVFQTFEVGTVNLTGNGSQKVTLQFQENQPKGNDYFKFRGLDLKSVR